MVFGGGGYFRLFPYWMIKKLMKGLSYNMTYLHMRDFDHLQPRFDHLSAMRTFKSYYGIKGAYPKFEKMLADFQWLDLHQAVEKVDFQKAKCLELN